MEKTEPIVLKGTIEGVKVVLSEDATIMEILEALHQKVRAKRSFFRGSCNIIITGRTLTHADEMRITSVLSAILPDCRVSFGEIVHKNHTAMGEKFLSSLEEQKNKTQEQLKNVVHFDGEYKEIFPEKLNVRLYEGNVRAGQVINSSTDVLVVGNVLEGGRVSSIGSIYVLGKLIGEAHAGIEGDESSKIFTLRLMSKTIAIGEYFTNLSDKISSSAPVVATISGKAICFEELP